MKIDIFAHILPEKYFDRLSKGANAGTDFSHLNYWVSKNRGLSDIEVRLRVMDRYPDVSQVLTLIAPPLETLVSPGEAVELAKLANDEMAELVALYPDKFLTAVACLPLNDIDEALREAERALSELHFRGIQVFTNINGKPMDASEFRPLYGMMAKHDLPIWIHPWDSPILSRSIYKDFPESEQGLMRVALWALGWPFDTSLAMIRLAASGIFDDHPDIKFITHHCGGLVPFLERRIAQGPRHGGLKHLSKFYLDTALNGNTSALMCGYGIFGPDRLLFGTDMPQGSGGSGYGATLNTIRAIEGMDIPDGDKDKIFERNAIELLKLPI